MTETLQDKIDNILRDTMSEHWQAIMINKAIQELREEIKKQFTLKRREIGGGSGGSWSFDYQDIVLLENDVLALIGEKK